MFDDYSIRRRRAATPSFPFSLLYGKKLGEKHGLLNFAAIPPDKRGKLERWMRASWQIHDVNTFVSSPKWAGLSLRCRINASQIKLPGYTQTQLPLGRGRGPSTGRKTHCDATAPSRIRPVFTTAPHRGSTPREINSLSSSVL